MNEFEKALLRLKEQLNVATDRDVAEKIGLGEKALNARKKRDSFPIKEVFALAAEQPELGIDPDWVVTGVSKHFETQDIAERHLVECYRLMTTTDKRALSRVASALSGVAAITGEEILKKLAS